LLLNALWQPFIIGLEHLGWNDSKHLPASPCLPFLAGEFNQVRFFDSSVCLKMSSEVVHSPEWAAFGQSACSFSILDFFPELA
jgi:hypothetical protein